jgi:hypothetical protein
MEINRDKRRSYWAIGLLNRDSIGPAKPFLGTSVNKQDRSTLGRVVSSDAVHKSERENPAGYCVLVSLWLQPSPPKCDVVRGAPLTVRMLSSYCPIGVVCSIGRIQDFYPV